MTNKFGVKKEKLELLSRMYDILESEKANVSVIYDKTGEKETRTDYKTGEIKCDENGEPLMFDVWADREKEDDEYTDDDRMKLAAIEQLMKELEKLA